VVFQHKGARSRSYSEGVSARLSMYGVMLNGYLDLSNKTILTPYIMAGAGLGNSNTRIRVVGAAGTSRRTNFIWHAGAGCQAKLDKNLSLDLSYRYEDLGRFGSKTLENRTVRIKRPAAHEFTAGLVYNFASTSASKRAHNFVLVGGGFMKFR
jgi:outer membrane autotransporter protein